MCFQGRTEKRVGKFGVGVFITMVLFHLGPTHVWAAATSWKINGTGDWSVASNWSGGEPDQDIYAWMERDGVLQITEMGEACKGLYITGWMGITPEVHILSGELTAVESLRVGYYNTEQGAVIQSGGRVVTGHFLMAQGSGSTGTYDLEDGEFETTAADLGVWGGPVEFNQTGGSFTVDGVMILTQYYGTNNDATYNLSGGAFKAATFYISGNDNGGDGEFNILDASASIEITDSLHIKPKGSFHAVPDTVIRLTQYGGFTVEKESSATDLGDLDNLTLIYSTLSGPGPSGYSGELEVFAEDTGLDGLASSPRFGTITLSRAAQVWLFDNLNNTTGSPVHALYVRNLNLSKGATLHLNGCNVYCECFLNMGGTVDDSQGGAVMYEEECHVFTVEADPDNLPADGVSTSQITSTLIVDGTPEPWRQIRFYTDKGVLTDGVTTDTSILTVTDFDGRATVELIADDSGAGTASVYAEVPEWDWTVGCEVQIIDYHIWTTAETALYTRIPSRTAPYEVTFPDTFFSASVPMPTLYGETRIPVTLQVEGLDPGGLTIQLSSEMADTCGSDQIWWFPATVVTESDGTAEFTLVVDNPYQTLVGNPLFMSVEKEEFLLDLVLQVKDHPGSKKTIEFPFMDNYRALVRTYEENVPDGHIWNMTDPFNVVQYPAFWPLIVSGVWAGMVTDALDGLWELEHLTIGLRESPYEPFTCGCYQTTVLELLDKTRLEEVSEKSSILLNGFHYGPVKIVKGFHRATMIWPSHRVWGDSDWTQVWDPWISQYPEGAYYGITDWAFRMGIVVPIVGWAMDLFIEPGSSDPIVNVYYPPNSGGSYPSVAIRGCKEGMPDVITIFFHCPIDLTVTDDQGRRVGLLPGTPEGENPLLDEIPDAEFYTQLLPDGTRAFLCTIPRQNLTMDMSGTQGGTFSGTLLAVDEQGKMVNYSLAPIIEGQTVQVIVDPNDANDPVMVYDNGDLVLPDETISLHDLGYDENADRTALRVSIANRTTYAFHTPLHVILDQVDPSTISAISWDGIDSQGRPYLDLSGDLTDGRLDPGGSVQRTVYLDSSGGNPFSVSLSLIGLADTGGNLTARRMNFKLNELLCGKHYFITPPRELTENNAPDWYGWADQSSSEYSYLENDPFRKVQGTASVVFFTDGAFDTFIRYPATYEAKWDLSAADALTISLYAENPSEYNFQSGPVVQLKKDADNYLEYVYYQEGDPYPLVNEAVNQWQNLTIPLGANTSETDGWRLTQVGQADLSEVAYVEIHADTWDSGFVLWIDNMSFDLPEYRYRDFDCDGQVGSYDLLIMAAQWLNDECGFASSRATDLNQSHRVDLSDFALFAEQWLAEVAP